MTRTILRAALLAITLTGCCGPDDTACTQAQDELAGAMVASGALAARAPPRPLFTTCTRYGCITQ